jgi:pyruvate carboxylase
MTDREQELRELADDLREHDTIVDVWTAKSFTDRLFVVEVEPGTDLPGTVRERLLDHGLQGYNDVHDVNAADDAFAGALDRGDRYQFVDVQSRGQLQSYVVE